MQGVWHSPNTLLTMVRGQTFRILTWQLWIKRATPSCHLMMCWRAMWSEPWEPLPVTTLILFCMYTSVKCEKIKKKEAWLPWLWSMITWKVSPFRTLYHDQDWVAQSSIKFKHQLNPKCKLISCIFQAIWSVNWQLNLIKVCVAQSRLSWFVLEYYIHTYLLSYICYWYIIKMYLARLYLESYDHISAGLQNIKYTLKSVMFNLQYSASMTYRLVINIKNNDLL